MNSTKPTATYVSKRGASVVLRLLALGVMLIALWLALPRAAQAHSPHGCAIRGAVCSSANNLSRLRRLSPQNSLLSGTIPVTLGNLSDLESLYLNDNQQSGGIPSEPGFLNSLEALWLHSSQHSDTSPTIYRNPRPDGIPPPIAVASASPGDILHIRRTDRPDTTIEVGVGWVSPTGSHTILVGILRDQSLGQTYYIARVEGSSRVVRRWISPTSPLVKYVNWPVINTQFTVPVEIIRVIPLDERLPEHNMLVRRFDGADDRIFAYDATIQQWRHIPDWPTFQALGFYWCDVTAADSGFFDRITEGPPYPATTAPARDDYPNCRTG